MQKEPTLNGYIHACGKIIGGVKSIKLIEKCKIKEVILNQIDGSYSDIIPKENEKFAEYIPSEGTAQYSENVHREGNVLSVTHSIEFALDKMDIYSRKNICEIITASLCGIIAIVKTAENISFVVGYSEEMMYQRPLRIISSSASSGRKITDANQQTITISSSDISKARTLTAITEV